MGICNIRYNKKGEIIGVKDQFGNDSVLFKQIVSNPHLTIEQAVEIYKNVFGQESKTSKSNTDIQFQPPTAELYIERIQKLKSESPDTYWSVDIPPFQLVKKAEQDGRLVDVGGGMGIVTEDGNMVGMFKYDPTAKNTAKAVQAARIALGGIKLDNYDGRLTEIYKENGFRVTSRTPFNEEFAPKDWSEAKHGRPDVVAMVYDPQNRLDIQEEVFDNYDDAIAYRDGYVEQIKNEETFTLEDFNYIIKEGQWAILTGENPSSKKLPDEENTNRNSLAKKWLEDKGYAPIPVEGKYGNKENSFLVRNLDTDTAIEFANRFEQESVATDKGLVHRDGTINPRTKESDIIGGNFEDFYSTIQIEGTPVNFSIGYDFDTIENRDGIVYKSSDGSIFNTYKEANDSVDEGYIEGVMNGQTIFRVSATKDTNTVAGTINTLIKANILKAEAILDKDGTKLLITEGNSELKKVVNGIEVKDSFRKLVGGAKFAQTTEGNFVLNGKPNTMDLSDGLEVTKSEMFTAPYEDLVKKYGEDVAIEFLGAQVRLSLSEATLRDIDVEEIEDFVPENELQESLIKLLNKMGVKITSISDYVKRYAQKNGVEPSAQALADIANKIVAFKDGLITEEELTEEVSHFIVEAWESQEIENLLRNVHRTNEWQEHSNRYRQIYTRENPSMSESEVDNLVRREILGKILATSIRNRFSTENREGIQVNIIQKIRELFNNFIQWIKNNFKSDYQRQLDRFNKQIYQNLMYNDISSVLDIDQLATKKFTMYSKKTGADPLTTIENNISKTIDILEYQASRLRSATTKEELSEYKALINQKEEALKLKGFSEVTSVAKRHAEYLKRAVDRSENKDIPLSEEERSIYNTTKGILLANLINIKAAIKEAKYKSREGIVLKNQVDSTIDIINDVMGKIGISEDSVWEKQVERVAKKLSLTDEVKQKLLDMYIERSLTGDNLTIGQYNEKANAWSVYSPELKGNIWVEGTRNSSEADILAKAKDIVKNKKTGGQMRKNTNWFFAHISSMVQAQDPALNVASSIISKITTLHNIRTNKRLKNFLNRLEELGISPKALNDYKRGNYLFNLIDWEALDADLLKEKTRKYNELKSGEQLTEEQFEQMEIDDELDLSPEEQLEFDEHIYNYRKENHWIDPLRPEERAKREKLYEGLSQRVARFDRRMSRERGAIAKEAKELGGFTQEHKYRLEEITKRRQRAKSPFDSDGRVHFGLKIDADGNVLQEGMSLSDEARFIADLHELDRRKLEFFKKENGDTKDIPQSFLDALDSSEDPLEYLLLNSRISFTSEFWDNLSENDTLAQKLKKEGSVEAQILSSKIAKNKARIGQILRGHKVHNQPSEIDYQSMGGFNIETVKDLTDELQNYYQEARAILDETSEDTEPVYTSVVNEAYKQELEDQGIETLQEVFYFIRKHVSTRDGISLDKARIAAEDIIEGRGERLSKFYKSIFSEDYSEDKNQRKEEVYRDLVAYSESKLLPYFKRIEPVEGTSFSAAFDALKAGAITPQDFLKYAEESPYVSVEPNYIFYSDESKDELLNDTYRRNEELGIPQINESYHSKEFKEHFGLDNNFRPTKNLNEHSALQSLVELQEDNLKATGMSERHNKYLVPQFGKRGARQIQDLWKRANTDTIKEIVKDMTSFRSDEQQYGESVKGQALSGLDGDMRIPKYGFRKLKDKGDVTDELLFSYALMTSEAELYNARLDGVGELEAIKDLVANSEYGGKKGEASQTYKMLDSFIRYNIYGQNETFSYETDIFGLLPNKINLAPLAKKFQWWVRLVNMGFNIVVPLTSVLQGTANLTIERFVQERLDKDASKLGNKLVPKLLSGATGEFMKFNTKSRLNSLAEFFGAFDLTRRFTDSNYGKLTRGLLKSGFMAHTLGDAPLKAKVIASVLSDFRIVDGDILNFKQFRSIRKLQSRTNLDEDKLREEWRQYEDKIAYNYLHTENGVTSWNMEALSKDLGMDTESEQLRQLLDSKQHNIRDSISVLGQEVNYLIPQEERSIAQRHAIFSFFFLHRGWLAVAYNRKLKGRHINLHTGLEEEGNWTGTFTFLKGLLNEYKNPNRVASVLGTIKQQWERADDTTRKSLHRTMVEFAMANSLAALSLLLMGFADDDEDVWALQFGAYMGYRVSNEVISASIAYPNQIFEAIESPIIGIDKLRGAADIFDVFSNDVVERGKYAGETERMRFLYKNLPAFREYYSVTRASQTRQVYRFYNRDNFKWTATSYFLNQNKDEE